MPKWAHWLWARINDGSTIYTVWLVTSGIGTPVLGFLAHLPPILYFPFAAATMFTGVAALRYSMSSIEWLSAHRKSPLEILFDPANPDQRYWSLENGKNEFDGKGFTYWEYRVAIRNRFAKTLRNVKVTVEAIGAMPSRPEPSLFDMNKQQLIDLDPGREALAVLRRWFNPPLVAGMAVGPGIYGPIKLTASADDTPPVSKLFEFDPLAAPMLWEIPPPAPGVGDPPESAAPSGVRG